METEEEKLESDVEIKKLILEARNLDFLTKLTNYGTECINNSKLGFFGWFILIVLGIILSRIVACNFVFTNWDIVAIIVNSLFLISRYITMRINKSYLETFVPFLRKLMSVSDGKEFGHFLLNGKWIGNYQTFLYLYYDKIKSGDTLVIRNRNGESELSIPFTVNEEK